jgi:hypothetical protein
MTLDRSSKHKASLPGFTLHELFANLDPETRQLIKDQVFRRERNYEAELVQEILRQKARARRSGKEWIPEPKGALRKILDEGDDQLIHLAGGGGAGRFYPAVFHEASRFGHNLPKVKIINATSVGTIQQLMIALNYSASDMKIQLLRVPADKFLDWDLWSVLTAFQRWGICRGEEMENFLKKAIKEKTQKDNPQSGGLDDPTFKELYDAGYKKDFRVIITDAITGRMKICSWKRTPHEKVAAMVATACKIPVVYPPLKRINSKGKEEIYTDGGLVQNYPWGIDCKPNIAPEKHLGFMFVRDQEKRTKLETFWHYLYSLIWIVFFPKSDSLPEVVKNRTLQIKIGDHNILKFTATRKEQKKIDESAQRSVREYIATLCRSKLKLLPAYELKKIKKEMNYPSKKITKPRRILCR